MKASPLDNNNSNNTYSISPDALAKTANYNDFICCICLNICFQPIQLDCCEKLLCMTCFEKLIEVNHKVQCPYCNNKKFTFNLVSKLVLRLFEALIFKCVDCSMELAYNYYHQHIYNDCANKLTSSSSPSAYCKQCQVITASNSIHNCKDYIKELMDFESKSEVEKRIAKMKLKLLMIELPKDEVFMNDDGSYKIDKLHRHPLYLTNIRTNPAYDEGWLCELCSDIIRQPNTKSYHCDKCTFDVCEKCILYISTKIPYLSIHQHELNLEMRDCLWDCSVCGNEYYKRHSWYCDTCDFDVCVMCYWIDKGKK